MLTGLMKRHAVGIQGLTGEFVMPEQVAILQLRLMIENDCLTTMLTDCRSSLPVR